MSGSEKKEQEQEHKQQNFCDYISSIKRLTRKFRVIAVQNNGKGMYKKSVLLCFLLIAVAV